jgi:hypothetical protein
MTVFRLRVDFRVTLFESPKVLDLRKLVTNFKKLGENWKIKLPTTIINQLHGCYKSEKSPGKHLRLSQLLQC